VPKGYVVGRSLSSYFVRSAAGFTRSLAGLGPNDRWLDIGAGEGRAVLDYCTSKYDGTLLKEAEPGAKKAKAIAMSIEDRRTPSGIRRLRISKPARSSTCSAGGCVTIQAEELGQFQVITDVMGGFSYAQEPVPLHGEDPGLPAAERRLLYGAAGRAHGKTERTSRTIPMRDS
jgi:hypothetical protein